MSENDKKKKKLAGLEPAKVFGFFELCSSVPHGSGNTGAIASVCEEFARVRGLRCVRDSLNNIVIYKPGTPGYEDHRPVILQAHLDMVCATSPGAGVDMKTAPVDLRTDGEWVWAEGTSLGGDDIAGVAMIMAVLDSRDVAHPPIEALFTVDEETGMFGAKGLDPSLLCGRRMINLDSDEEGIFTVGCSGGQRMDLRLPVGREPRGEETAAFRLTVSGLLGGHSGAEIDRERGNSHLLAARLLSAASAAVPELRLDSLTGGSFDNVIPSRTDAVAVVPASRVRSFRSAVDRTAADIAFELSASDPGFRAELTRLDGRELPRRPLTAASTRKLLSMLTVLPNGVRNMSMDIKGLVQTSLNLGKVRLGRKEFSCTSALRSSIGSQKDYLALQVKTAAGAFGAKVRFGAGYPAWTFLRESPLRDTASEVYTELFGKKPVIYATHGGLECGILSDKLGGLDCVSFGPELRDIHSVGEKMNVASVGRTYRFLCATLGRL